MPRPSPRTTRKNSNGHRRRNSRSRRQPFWTQPAQFQILEHDGDVDERGFRFPPGHDNGDAMLMHQSSDIARDSGGNVAPHNSGSRAANSRIPWSPGETLASESLLHAPLLASPSHGHSHFHNMHHDNDDDATGLRDNRHSHTRSTSSCCSRIFCCSRLLSTMRTTCCSSWCGCCGPSHGQDDEDFPQNEYDFYRDQASSRIRNRDDWRETRQGVGLCYKLVCVLLSAATFAALYRVSSCGNSQQWNMTPGESRHVNTAGFLTDTVQVMTTMPNVSPLPPWSSSSVLGEIIGNNHNHSSHNHTNHHNDTTTTTRGIAVYAMESTYCPLLTGPPVKIDAPQQEMFLLHNAFEYQYFYLNKGSTMHVTVHQTQGATNILVLRGQKVLSRMHSTDNKRARSNSRRGGQSVAHTYNGVRGDVGMEFSDDQVLLERFSWTEQGGPIDFSFTSPASDVYILLFDNAASSQAAKLQVKYQMLLTTYNLEGLTPWCSHTSPIPSPTTMQLFSSPISSPLPYNTDMEDHSTASFFACPPLQVSTAGCIIVQAVEHHLHNDSDDDNHSGGSNSSSYNSMPLSFSSMDPAALQFGEGLVQVTLSTTRNWYYIGGLSLLPSLLLALWSYGRRCKRDCESNDRDRHFSASYPRQGQRVHPSHHLHLPQQQQQQRSQRSRPSSRRAGPNYQYLPSAPQNDERIDRETLNAGDVTMGTNGVEETEGQQHRQQQRALEQDDTEACPNDVTHTIQEGNESQSRTTMIPAENVHLVEEQE